MGLGNVLGFFNVVLVTYLSYHSCKERLLVYFIAKITRIQRVT